MSMPPLTDKQRLWNKIGLYGVKVPCFVIAALPIAWIGTFMLEVFTSGNNIETGGTAASSAVSNHAAFVMAGFFIVFSWFTYQYLLKIPDVIRLMENDPDAQNTIPRWVAVEMIVLNIVAFFVMIASSHA